MIKDLSTNIVYLSIENLTVPNEKGFWSSVKKSNSCTVVGPVPTHTSRPSPRPRFDARNTRHRLDTSRTRDHGRTDPRLGPRDEEHSRHQNSCNDLRRHRAKVVDILPCHGERVLSRHSLLVVTRFVHSPDIDVSTLTHSRFPSFPRLSPRHRNEINENNEGKTQRPIQDL